MDVYDVPHYIYSVDVTDTSQSIEFYVFIVVNYTDNVNSFYIMILFDFTVIYIHRHLIIQCAKFYGRMYCNKQTGSS